jgi:hypothetical protein
MKRAWIGVIGLSVGISTVACVEATDVPAAPGGPPIVAHDSLERLQPIDSCEALQAQLTGRALTQMERLLKRNQAIAEAPCPGGSPDAGAGPEPAGPGAEGDPGAPPGEGGGDGFGGAIDGDGRAVGPDVSERNNQVVGVDEADIVETDGEHLYVLVGEALHVLRVFPFEQAGLLASLPIEGATRMFVDGDRAVVYADGPEDIYDDEIVDAVYGHGGAPPSVGGLCPFGHRCEFSGNGRALRIVTVDLSDRAAPRVVRETDLNGSFLAARRIGDAVHTVVEFPPPVVPGLHYWPDGVPACGAEPAASRAAFDALREANGRVIAARPLTDWLPAVTDVRHAASGPVEVDGLLEACESIWYDQLQDGRGFLSVVSQTMAGDQDVAATTLIGEPGAVFSSAEALYIASRHRAVEGQGWYVDLAGEPEATVIHRFALREEDNPLDARGRPVVAYRGSVALGGLVLDQFAMDERDGLLRVLTTHAYTWAAVDDPIVDFEPTYARDVVVPSPDRPAATRQHATFSVLGADEVGLLSLRSAIDGVASDLKVSAVRYRGDWGFLGFAEGGPLQLIDLRDDEKPALRGRIQTEGEPRFLHPIGEGLLLVVGQKIGVSTGEGQGSSDGEPQVATAGGGGVTLELVDVSDPDAPRAVGGASFAGGDSEAVTDHLAVTWFAPASAVALPLRTCAEGMVGFDGLVIYDVSPDGGFAERGRVDHGGADAGGFCEDEPPRVRRSVFVDDAVVSVGLDRVAIVGLDDFSAPRAVIELWDGAPGDGPEPATPDLPEPAPEDP